MGRLGSEVEDTMDNNDIIGIDECDEDDNSNFNIDLGFDENTTDLTSNKRRTCSGLHNANFGSSRHVETIAKEM